jgi:hypothetical protein
LDLDLDSLVLARIGLDLALDSLVLAEASFLALNILIWLRSTRFVPFRGQWNITMQNSHFEGLGEKILGTHPSMHFTPLEIGASEYDPTILSTTDALYS